MPIPYLTIIILSLCIDIKVVTKKDATKDITCLCPLISYVVLIVLLLLDMCLGAYVVSYLSM